MTEVTGDRNGAVYKAFKFTRHLSCTQGLEDGIFLEGVFPIPAVEPGKATPVGEEMAVLRETGAVRPH